MNMDPSLLKILLLLSFWSPTEEEKTTATQQHYQRKNSSFCLQAAESPPYALSLTFGQNSVIYSNITSQAYQHRVDYNQTTKKWCLHQLSETDSGTYHFNVYKNDKVNMSNHKLLVEEAVPRPVIQVSALRSNLSAEPCTITVNCSVWESWVSSVCNESVCQTSDRSLKTVNITVLTGNRSVICIGRNYVSTSSISEAICLIHRLETSEELLYVLLVLLLAILSLLCAAILCMYIKHRRDTRSLQKIQPVEMPRAPSVSSRVSNASSQSEVAYENVSPTTSGQDRRMGTIYQSVDRPQEASGGSRTPEAKNHGDVETVYSVLQKV